MRLTSWICCWFSKRDVQVVLVGVCLYSLEEGIEMEYDIHKQDPSFYYHISANVHILEVGCLRCTPHATKNEPHENIPPPSECRSPFLGIHYHCKLCDAAVRRPSVFVMPEMQQRESLLSSVNTNSVTSKPQADPHEPSSLPPWVHINEGEDQDALLLPPNHARPNTRHYKPPPAHYKPGRKWDHLRSAEPPLLSAPIADEQQRWKPFMQSGPNPQTREGRMVDAAWMEEHMPDLNPDYYAEDEVEASTAGPNSKGLMYQGKWLISPERQEQTVRFFWVSTLLSFHWQSMVDGWCCEYDSACAA